MWLKKNLKNNNFRVLTHDSDSLDIKSNIIIRYDFDLKILVEVEVRIKILSLSLKDLYDWKEK